MIKISFSFLFFFFTFNIFCQQIKPDALILYRNGQYKEAITATLNEIKDKPNNLDSYIVLSWSLVKLKRYKEAVEYSQIALRLNQGDPRVLFILGESCYNLKEDEKAKEYFFSYIPKSVSLSVKRINIVYYYISKIYIRNKDMDKADFMMSYALSLFPNDEKLNLLKAMYLESLGSFQDSANFYEKVLKINPKSIEAKKGLKRVN